VVAISQPDFESGTYKIVSVASPVPIDQEWGSFPIEAGVTGRVYREKRTMLVPDVSQDPDYLGLVSRRAASARCPSSRATRWPAVLNVESDARRGFDRAHVITLETLADGVGILLRNAELFAALERTNVQLVELDRTKSELVNVVAHDFRAPLAGIPRPRGAPGVAARRARWRARRAGPRDHGRGPRTWRRSWTRR
jgi:GAF domain-containing protein